MGWRTWEGAGRGIEQKRSEKEKELMDTDNSVVNAGRCRGWERWRVKEK